MTDCNTLVEKCEAILETIDLDMPWKVVGGIQHLIAEVQGFRFGSNFNEDLGDALESLEGELDFIEVEAEDFACACEGPWEVEGESLEYGSCEQRELEAFVDRASDLFEEFDKELPSLI